jgi:hypothetical protein
MLAGDNQSVYRGNRVDIAEGDDLIIPVDDIGGQLPGDYFAENTVFVFINLPHPLFPH